MSYQGVVGWREIMLLDLTTFLGKYVFGLNALFY